MIEVLVGDPKPTGNKGLVRMCHFRKCHSDAAQTSISSRNQRSRQGALKRCVPGGPDVDSCSAGRFAYRPHGRRPVRGDPGCGCTPALRLSTPASKDPSMGTPVRSGQALPAVRCAPFGFAQGRLLGAGFWCSHSKRRELEWATYPFVALPSLKSETCAPGGTARDGAEGGVLSGLILVSVAQIRRTRHRIAGRWNAVADDVWMQSRCGPGCARAFLRDAGAGAADPS